MGAIDQGWRRFSACFGIDPSIFFAERSDKLTPEEIDAFARRGVVLAPRPKPPPELKPRIICGGCTVAAECITHSVVENEDNGIWGVGGTRRRFLRKQYLALERDQFLQVVAQEVELLRSGFVRTVETEARACERCVRQGLRSQVPKGIHPEDLNGPNARCGKPVTYARGCRCWFCRFAHAQRQGRPRVIITDDEYEEAEDIA